MPNKKGVMILFTFFLSVLAVKELKIECDVSKKECRPGLTCDLFLKICRESSGRLSSVEFTTISAPFLSVPFPSFSHSFFFFISFPAKFVLSVIINFLLTVFYFRFVTIVFRSCFCIRHFEKLYCSVPFDLNSRNKKIPNKLANLVC